MNPFSFDLTRGRSVQFLGATLANTISGANYNDTYVYTHLGQLWRAPRNGGSTQYQYLYCNSQPHELTGLYSLSSTCASKSGQGYASSYDAFGNVTTRTTSGTTGTLTYDLLDHFTQWYVSGTNQEQYLYEASGQRMLHRVTNSTSTTITTFPFGIEEHQYSGSGTNQSNTYYYFLAGHLLGSLDSNGTKFYLTDALGSLVSSFTNAQGGAKMKSNQLFGPYGNARYTAGTLNTAKGFIGQYNDGTGLDYFNARYYDPIAGVFLSADTVQGNAQGMNPYAYVSGNPETFSDPSGRYVVGPGGQTYYPGKPYYLQNGVAYQISTGTPYTGSLAARLPGHVPQPTSYTGTKPPTVKLPVSSCDAACVAKDTQLIIAHHDAVAAFAADTASLAMFAITAAADWGLGNASAVATDIVSLVAQALVVIKDFVVLNGGNVPGWLSALVHFGQLVVGTVNIVKGVFAFFGGLNFVLNSFSFVKGLFTAAKTEIANWVQSATASFLGGTATYVSGYVGLQDDLLSTMSPDELHNDCLALHLTGCA